MSRTKIVVLVSLSIVVFGGAIATLNGMLFPGPRPYDRTSGTLILCWLALLFWTAMFVFWTAGALRASHRRLARLAESERLERCLEL